MELRCPLCHESLIKDEKRYYCKNGHSFDLAKEGYLNLNLKSSQNSGDEKIMVRARKAFLEKGYYSFLKEKVCELIAGCGAKHLVDLGCGEGYYTSGFPVSDKIGIDLSKEAVKIASKSDKSTRYVLKTIFDVPVDDSSADMAVTIFAPVSSEIARILKKDGYFLLVKPDRDHLYELKKAVYDHPYYNEIQLQNIDEMVFEEEYKIARKAVLKRDDLIHLFRMTPYYHKTALKDFQKLENIEELEVTFAFILDLYRKNQ